MLGGIQKKTKTQKKNAKAKLKKQQERTKHREIIQKTKLQFPFRSVKGIPGSQCKISSTIPRLLGRDRLGSVVGIRSKLPPLPQIKHHKSWPSVAKEMRAIIPCRFFNKSTCRHATKCTFSHEPDDQSIQFLPGYPNNCLKHILKGLGIGDGCDNGSGNPKETKKCYYSHAGPEKAVLGQENLDAKLNKVIHEERRRRVDKGLPTDDIDDYLKRTWLERSYSHATRDFVVRELPKTYGYEDAETRARKQEEYRISHDESEQRGKESDWIANMKDFIISQNPDLTEQSFFENFLRPRLREFMRSFVPPVEEQEMVFNGEIERIREGG